MSVKIRSAHVQDAFFLARIMLMAGRGHVEQGIWDIILGQPDDGCLAFLERLCTTKEPHLFHSSGFLIAEVDRHPVAALGGFDPSTSGMKALIDALHEVFQELAIPEANYAAGFQRYLRILPGIPPLTDDAWIIDSVATLPEFRRRGMVNLLLDNIIDRGRQQGFRRAQLTMHIGNIAAQRAYEKHGFKVVEERRHPDFESLVGAPGMLHLICDF